MMRFALYLLLTTSLSCAAEPRTMRVDFYHTGTAEEESFSLDRVVREALPFAGRAERRTETRSRGKYLFEVLVPGSAETLFSRSFSSIYGEWETTAEASTVTRTFHESLRFPEPASAFDLILKKRTEDNAFEEIWHISVDPDDILVHEESASYRAAVTAIRHNGDPSQKVDILLLGDGYTAAEHEKFLATAKSLTDTLFATEPFASRRNDFNVWALAPPSAVAGVSRPSTGVYRDSPIGATYDAFRSERYILTYNNREWRRIAASAPYDFVEILTNSETYGGGGIYGLFSTAAANSAWNEYLFIHEFAHHFAGLADEYYTSAVAYESPTEIREPYEPNVTALLDPDNLKWRDLVGRSTPLPTPWPKMAYETHAFEYQQRRSEMREQNVAEGDMNELFNSNQNVVEGLFSAAPYKDVVGAFEGAAYQARGLYRPEQNCIMFTRTADFCRVCAAAIEEVIDEHTR